MINNKKIIFKNYEKNFLNNLSNLIKLDTSLQNDTDKYPTKNQKKAVELMHKLGEENGFKSFSEKDGHYGYVEIGEGKEIVGILAHLDVVSANSKDWKTDPFELSIIDETIYGRGVIDDKGPLMLNFYVLKALLDSKIKLNKRFRLIYGTDEESFWRGIKKYVENEEIPTIGYTPDSSFPVIYAEKALLQLKIISDIDKENNLIINGGNTINAVPSEVKIKSVFNNEIIKNLNKKNLKFDNKNNEITIFGKSSHAMKPEEGINAIYELIKFIPKEINNNFISFIRDEMNFETNGKKLFNELIKNDDIGEITVNLGKIETINNKVNFYLDIRIPNETYSKEEIIKLIKNKTNKYNLKLEEYDYLKPVYHKKDSELVNKLMKSYIENTNNFNSKPISTGGATYARSMDNIVAFGPYTENKKSSEHQPNENIKLSIYEKAFKIYFDSLISLND